MRLIYVTDAFALWGGLERVLTDKLNYLADRYGYDVSIITVNQGVHKVPFPLSTKIGYFDLGIRMHQQYDYHGVKRLLKRWGMKHLLNKRMRWYLQEVRPDVIICVKFDFVGTLLKVKGEVPLIVESHTLCHAERLDGSGWLRRLHVLLWKWYIRRVDGVVALTEGDAMDWGRINRHVYVIPDVVHLNDSELYCDCHSQSVIFVGRFSQQKDICSLLQIWELVHLRHPEWSLEIYGDGELKEDFLPIIKEMNAAIHVFSPTAEIMEKYRQSAILLLTSVYEPFGLVLPEAMSCGLPVVSFDCPYGPADIITDGVDGFLIKDRNIELFAQRVCQLISDIDLRVRMGKAGVISSQRYRAEVIMPQWIRLFEGLTSSQGK